MVSVSPAQFKGVTTHQQERCGQEQTLPPHIQIGVVEVNVCGVTGVVSVPGSGDAAHLLPMAAHGEDAEVRLLWKAAGQRLGPFDLVDQAQIRVLDGQLHAKEGVHLLHVLQMEWCGENDPGVLPLAVLTPTRSPGGSQTSTFWGTHVQHIRPKPMLRRITNAS